MYKYFLHAVASLSLSHISRLHSCLVTGMVLFNVTSSEGRSQWPRDLRRRSAASRLLRLRVRFPPVFGGGGGQGCLSVVSVACCQVEVSATG